jgi:mannan endo-1,4-beta-mannosidase
VKLPSDELSQNVLLMKRFLIYGLLVVATLSCNQKTTPVRLADENASESTRVFYQNLRDMQGKALMFGHQATLHYGYHWTRQDLAPGELRSDVKDVTGSFPSVYGFAVNAVANLNWSEEQWMENVERQLAIDKGIYERGGVITYEWHMYHPANGKSFYDTTPVVHRIIPGGDLHENLKAILDQAAGYFLLLGDIPILFRPWHEHNGDWFWWCKGSTSEEDFVALWRFTVDYLKKEKGVHNLIYVYSPDRSRIDIDQFETDYLWGYPGDDYADVLGIDNYWDLGHPANKLPVEEQLSNLRRSLEYTVRIADARGKLAALTETGCETIPDPRWWTDVMLDAILHNQYTQRISYFLVWRNANFHQEKRDHYYAPFPGHPSAENFVEFKNHPYVWFEDDLPDLYSRKWLSDR